MFWRFLVSSLVFSQRVVPGRTRKLRGAEFGVAKGKSDNDAQRVRVNIPEPSQGDHPPGSIAPLHSQREVSPSGSMEKMDFHPLSCNNDIDSVECSSYLWSDQNFKTSTETVVIPCGVCVMMNYEEDILNLPYGLDIQGKLVFPDGYRVQILTPFVYVQGKLVITSTAPVSPENKGVNIVLVGTDQNLTSFVPHEDNFMACMGGSCNVGKKPFIVAGGELQISGLPEYCPSWINLHDVVAGGPIVPNSFPRAMRALDGCPRDIIDEAFDEGSAGWRGNLGAEYAVVSDNSSTSSPFLLVSDRTRDWQGPYFDIVDMKDCLIPDTTYLFYSRLRLTKSSGMSDCSISGGNCPTLVSRCRTEEDKEHSRVLGKLHPATSVPDGEWFTFATEFMFTSEETDPDSVFELLYVEGPEPGVEIAIDSVMLTLPPEEAYPDPENTENICLELMPDVPSGIRDVPYPFYSTRPTAALVINTDAQSGNQLYTLKGRRDNWASMSSKIVPECIVKHAVYRFSGLFRLHSSITVENAYIEVRSIRGDGSAFSSQITYCPTMGGQEGWVRCESDIVFTEELEEAAAHEWRLVTGTDRLSDVDYFDLHFSFVHGPVKGLVLDKSVYPCWGVGSEVLITSHTIDFEDSQRRKIDDVIQQEGSDYVTLLLDASVLPPTTSTQDKNFAVEVALLSRNVVFEGLRDDGANERHGAHLMVLHSPDVQQRFEGVELRGFGQQGNLGRYPIHFHMCGSVRGAVVSKNLIKDSNQRCIVIHGSHNVLVKENVAYNTSGHCIMLEDGGERDNVFFRNLGANTKKVIDLISEDETDDKPSTYWITNPQNVFDGNVAAGSEGNGFWLELREAVRGPSAMLEENKGINPKKLSLLRFSNNVAHSSGSHGLRTYPSGFLPPESAVFYNTRSYRNNRDGVFFHNSRNISIAEGVFADNRIQIDIDRAKSVNISNALIVGQSALYRSIAESQKLYHVRSHCPDEKPIVGIQLHTFKNNKNRYTGAHLNDTVFDGFNDTGCSKSVAMNFDDEVRIGHFDFHSSFQNLRFLNGTDPLDMCTADLDGVEDVYVIDIDGSLDLTGTSSGTSSIVSNKKWMTEFLGNNCTPVPEMCYAYCHGACLRTVTYAVDAFGTDDMVLHVYDFPGHSRMFDVKGNWQRSTKMAGGSNVRVTDVYGSTFYDDRRYFSATLPVGSYAAEFRHENGTMMWPTYALVEYEEAPPCDGYLEKDAVRLIAPEVTQSECKEVVKNGGAELGNYTYWYHTGGGVGVEQYAGVKGSWALVSTRRHSEYHGLATYLDSRCISIMKGVEFEVEAKVQLEVEGFPYECDPDASSYSDACPQVSIMMETIDESAMNGRYRTERHGVAKALKPKDGDGWYTLHGVFTVSEEMSYQDSIMIYISRTFKKAKLLLDDVSVHAMPDRCTQKLDGDMILNGDMELLDTRYWQVHGPASLDVAPSAGVEGTHAIVISNRFSRYTGPRQGLTSNCFEADKQYEITASFKLLSRGGEPLVCEQHSSSSDKLRCPEGRLRVEQKGKSRYIFVAKTIDPGDSDGRWGTIHGIFSASEDTATASGIHLYFDRAAERVDIILDNVTLKPYERDCANLIDNGDAEIGDTRSWERYGHGTIAVSGQGTNGSRHSLIASGRTSTGWGIAQRLPTECFEAGDTYYLSAKVKLVNATDGTDYQCNPSMSSGYMSCPVATLKAEGNGYMYRDIAKVNQKVDFEGWYDMHGVFEVFESDAVAPRVLVYFRGAPKGVDIIIDDVQARRWHEYKGS